MPINYQQIHNQVKAMGEQALRYQECLNVRLKQILEKFHEYSNKLDALRILLKVASREQPGFRCAVPAKDSLMTVFDPPPGTIPHVLLAADGSQITPSHHDAVEFGVINTSIFYFRIGEIPHEFTDSDLLYFEDLEKSGGLATEDYISLARDLKERQSLAKAASEIPGTVVTLTDGPLEIYGEPKADRDFDSLFTEYLESLRLQASRNIIVAGYVDKPRADLIVRLIELTTNDEQKTSKEGNDRPFAGVRDSDIFMRILKPGQRSGIFGIQSRSSVKFTDAIALNFFYLNSGTEINPALARVEIPAWVAQNRESIDLLHSCLLEQNQLMGNRPYPYALHRAHEIAVVTYHEKEQISDMITQEYLRHGIDVPGNSNKQSAKELPGKKRYGA
jgi:hypothetical protein